MTEELCGCMKCSAERRREDGLLNPLSMLGFRYACEICGNKRCPHHSDHALACTNSNEPGQQGSVL